MAGSIGSSNVDRGGDRQQPPSDRTRRKAKASMPLTAMIDVTFLLLSYFLLTTTFRQDEGQLPGTLPGPPDPNRILEPIVIPLQVRATGDNCQSAVYSLGGDGKPLRSPRELVDSLRARKERIGENVNVIVVIQAGRAVRWRYIVEACNQATRVNFQTTIRFYDQT